MYLWLCSYDYHIYLKHVSTYNIKVRYSVCDIRDKNYLYLFLMKYQIIEQFTMFIPMRIKVTF